MDEKCAAERYESLTVGLALGLAAPQTWAASVLPVLWGAALGAARRGGCDPVLFCCLLAICVLMQSAANTMNDYCDFIKRTDTLENSEDPSDAVLVYHKIPPRQVLVLGLGLLAAAGVLGVYVTVRCGWVPLAVGLFGGAVVLLYSFGRSPLSYLPVGELVSGTVMGGLIPPAVYTALTGEAGWWPCLSAPLVLGIGMIMLTNNISDIERDTRAGRRTLPVLLGRRRSAALYRAVLIAWPLLTAAATVRSFPRGSVFLAPLALLAGPQLRRQASLPLTPEVRGRAMPGILQLNVLLGLGYAVMPLLHRALGAWA